MRSSRVLDDVGVFSKDFTSGLKAVLSVKALKCSLVFERTGLLQRASTELALKLSWEGVSAPPEVSIRTLLCLLLLDGVPINLSLKLATFLTASFCLII